MIIQSFIAKPNRNHREATAHITKPSLKNKVLSLSLSRSLSLLGGVQAEVEADWWLGVIRSFPGEMVNSHFLSAR